MFELHIKPHYSNADVSQLWMESQIAVDKTRKSTLSLASKAATWRDSVYLSLFKSKRYTLMFMCDTMGFFAYMIVMQYLTDKIRECLVYYEMRSS